VVLYGLPFASINGVESCTSLRAIALRKALEGSGNGGWLREALKPPCLGQRSLGPNTGIDVAERLAATHAAHQAGEAYRSLIFEVHFQDLEV
jgi:hypothetical protein